METIIYIYGFIRDMAGFLQAVTRGCRRKRQLRRTRCSETMLKSRDTLGDW